MRLRLGMDTKRLPRSRTPCRNPLPPNQAQNPSRRTRFAEERTLLAWWRTGIGAAAVAVAVGGILPKLSTVSKDRALALGVAYGAFALMFVVGGSFRDYLSRKAMEEGSFADVSPKAVTAITVYASALIILTVLALF